MNDFKELKATEKIYKEKAKELRKKDERRKRATSEKKAKRKNNFLIFFTACFLFLIQVSIVVLGQLYLTNFMWVYLGVQILALIVVIFLYSREWNAYYKLSWMLLIMAFPLVGLFYYIFIGRPTTMGYNKRKKLKQARYDLEKYYANCDDILADIKEKDPVLYGQLYYLNSFKHYPVYKHTDVTYHDAKDGLKQQIADIKKAKKFILIEYYAVEDKKIFKAYKKALIEKAKEGVEIRFMYDDVGSVSTLNKTFKKELQQYGIKARIYNPLRLYSLLGLNNRDHRKKLIIDGEIAYVTGYNLADEYFNVTHPYGMWKDSGVRLKGDAVNSLILTFFETWLSIKKDEDISIVEKYLQPTDKFKDIKTDGFVAPYADGPTFMEPFAENVYLNIIKGAHEEIRITTPYLITDDEVLHELSLAAKRGVKVTIYTPGIPDKKTIFKVTRSNYVGLVKDGVIVKEWNPGFLHQKVFLVDNKYAIVGTINLDYRSLCHHFEEAIYIYNMPCIKDIKMDLDKIDNECRDVSEVFKKVHFFPFLVTFIRIFSPLL